MSAAATALEIAVYAVIGVAIAMFMFPLFPRELNPDDSLDQTLVMALAILWPVILAGFVLVTAVYIGWRAVRWPFRILARAGLAVANWLHQHN